MAEVKCIACNRMNAAGDRFCAACGSSLDLKLCNACEAINNPVADNCHSCGKPLPTAEAPATPMVEVSEAPFYPPQRRERPRQVYDARPSLLMRLNQAAKVTILVLLPLAAIGLWGWQFYGQKLLPTQLLQSFSPSAKMPAAELQTKVAAPAVVGPLPAVVVTETPKAKPAVAEAKRPPKSSAPAAVRTEAVQQAPAAVEKRTVAGAATEAARKGVTHTKAGAVAAVAQPNQAPSAPEATAPAAPADPRSRVTHTRGAPIAATVQPAEAASAPAAAASATPDPAATGASTTSTSAVPAAPTGGSASCPQAAAVLGLCSPNIQKGGS